MGWVYCLVINSWLKKRKYVVMYNSIECYIDKSKKVISEYPKGV